MRGKMKKTYLPVPNRTKRRMFVGYCEALGLRPSDPSFHSGSPLTLDGKEALPLGNYDVYEDRSTLINRLYYVVSEFDGKMLHCRIYYEENIFSKNTQGDLELRETSFHAQPSLE